MDQCHELDTDLSTNTVWVENVIINNLENVCSSMYSEWSSSTVGSSKSQMSNDLKVVILEHELHTGDYFGEDRFPTLTQIVSMKIKFLINEDTEEKYQFWILKLPSESLPERHLAMSVGVSRREIRFYTEILPDIKRWVHQQFAHPKLEFRVPLCLYGQFNRPYDEQPVPDVLQKLMKAESILALEDLRANGYGKRHFSLSLTVPEVMIVLNEIAKIHATTWTMQETSREAVQWKDLINGNESIRLYQPFIDNGFKTLLEFLTGYDDPEASNVAEFVIELKSEIQKLLGELLSPPQLPSPTCLIHLDLWSENILFRIKNEDKYCTQTEEADLECYILDWQMVQLGRPTHDVALLLMTSMSPELRRESTKILLQYYFQVFKQTTELFGYAVPFNYTCIEEEYHKSCLLATLLSVASIDIVLLEDSTQRRLIEALKDLKKQRLINSNYFE